MTTILTKKFTKLRKELQYWQSELEYIQEVLKEWHHKFEEYHREFCVENEIDLAELNRKNSEAVKSIIPPSLCKMPESGTQVFEDKTDEKHFKKIYKKLVKKLHPDVGGDEEEFKEVMTAMSEKNFDKLLDISEKHDILIEMDEDLIKVLSKQIERKKQEIDKEKSTYSWKLYSCGESKECKESLIKDFLKQLFDY